MFARTWSVFFVTAFVYFVLLLSVFLAVSFVTDYSVEWTLYAWDDDHKSMVKMTVIFVFAGGIAAFTMRLFIKGHSTISNIRTCLRKLPIKDKYPVIIWLIMVLSLPALLPFIGFTLGAKWFIYDSLVLVGVFWILGTWPRICSALVRRVKWNSGDMGP